MGVLLLLTNFHAAKRTSCHNTTISNPYQIWWHIRIRRFDYQPVKSNTVTTTATPSLVVCGILDHSLHPPQKIFVLEVLHLSSCTYEPPFVNLLLLPPSCQRRNIVSNEIDSLVALYSVGLPLSIYHVDVRTHYILPNVITCKNRYIK